jgi:hypothetical protein
MHLIHLLRQPHATAYARAGLAAQQFMEYACGVPARVVWL